MISQRALAKAQKLLGPKATVQRGKCHLYQARADGSRTCSGFQSHPKPCPGGQPLYEVGRVMLGMFNEIRGQGMTWAEAFARVELNQHRDGCRRCVLSLPCKKFRILDEAAHRTAAKEGADA